MPAAYSSSLDQMPASFSYSLHVFPLLVAAARRDLFLRAGADGVQEEDFVLVAVDVDIQTNFRIRISTARAGIWVEQLLLLLRLNLRWALEAGHAFPNANCTFAAP